MQKFRLFPCLLPMWFQGWRQKRQGIHPVTLGQALRTHFRFPSVSGCFLVLTSSFFWGLRGGGFAPIGGRFHARLEGNKGSPTMCGSSRFRNIPGLYSQKAAVFIWAGLELKTMNYHSSPTSTFCLRFCLMFTAWKLARTARNDQHQAISSNR